MRTTMHIAALLATNVASYAPRRRPAVARPVCAHQRRSLLRYAADGETDEDVQHIITCGSCKAVYAIDKEILGKGAGAKVQCEVCGNVWFQATARVNTLFDGFELKEYDAEKAQEAIDKQKARAKEAADRPPRKRGAATLFVANLPFRYSDDDVVALFAEVAPITSAQVVMDDDGRSRGYQPVQREGARCAGRDGQHLAVGVLNAAKGHAGSRRRARFAIPTLMRVMNSERRSRSACGCQC